MTVRQQQAVTLAAAELGDSRSITRDAGLRGVAYVLKAYGRTSETFITNEIHLLERLGLALDIFSIKQLEKQKNHSTLEKIRASVTFLPQTTELAQEFFPFWLWINGPQFLECHLGLLRKRPADYLRTLAEVVRMCFAYRRSGWTRPRTVFFKEFLQAGYIARRVLASEHVRHLHAHFCHGATTVAMLASRLSGVPFSFTAHAKDIYLKELNPGDLLQRKMRRAKFVVTCTDANRRHLLGVCADGAHVYTIYHGLDTDMFRPTPTRADQRNGESPTILSVGRLVEKKGFDCLLKAVHILRDRGHELRCLIVGGEDNYSDVIRKLVKELDLQEIVTIRNSVAQQELRDIYSRGTVFALPCQITDNGDRDGIPNVLAEAMAMEMPVVSTNISGIPELVRHGVNGLLVPPKDPTAMADAIEMLLAKQDYARRLGIAARSTICEVFDSKRNTVTLRTLLASQLQERRA